MSGLISKLIQASTKKGTTLKVLQRYLKMKYRIAVSEAVLTKRIENQK
tara:strand:+ start:10469 stop:10612 length:144 start_codon:yes stop_codon:yes gene_type:complete